jgi:hypothetical protein
MVVILESRFEERCEAAWSPDSCRLGHIYDGLEGLVSAGFRKFSFEVVRD